MTFITIILIVPVTAAPESNGAHDLLSALVTFLKPIIQGYPASHASARASTQTYHTEVQLINGVEGKNLLSALTTFVAAAVNSPTENCRQQENLPGLGMAPPVHGKTRSEVAAAPDVPKAVPQSELETKMLSAVRTHVFNKMPIRLLAFDKTGSNIQLIGRHGIFSCILPDIRAKISTQKFQLEWAEAETMEDFDLVGPSMQYRQNRMKELLQGVVEKSVDYAILSHTWMRDIPGDITFQDWATRERNPRGNAKIVKFCEVAAQNHNITLGWIDTVCINKESSSELDESIRSMYKWYQRASVCIAYLSETLDIPDAPRDSWFTRGWTLQELLAPARSVFYNKNWNRLGSSSDAAVQAVITAGSRITAKELQLSWSGRAAQIPLSRRMSMACGRHVTREEDTAYSLMGIFGVDISIAYGEGARRAFSRLVRELFTTKKNVIDLFNRSYDRGEGLFPSSPKSYRYRSTWYDYPDGGTFLDKYLPLKPIVPTHLGVRVPLLLAPALATSTADETDYVPRGGLSGKLSVDYFSETTGAGHAPQVTAHYLLFDSRLYRGEPLATLHSRNPAAEIKMLGLVNFGVDTSGHILLPETCFMLRFSWDGLQDGNLSPSGNVALRAGPPAHIRIKAREGLKIHKTEVEKHGMQLVSLYL